MVAVVGAGVVLLHVTARIADAADGAPIEGAEVDHQVGRDVADGPVDLLRFIHQRPHRASLVVWQRLQSALELVADRLVVPGIDRPARLPALHIEEDPGIVPTLAPRLGLLPIHAQLAERCHLLGILVEHQQPLAHQPLVHAKPAVQSLRPVVRDHEHHGIVRQQLENLADLLVQVEVIIADDVGIGTVRLVEHVLGIVVLPEPVVHPVQPDVHELEVVPLHAGEVMPYHGEQLPAHPEDFAAQPILLGGAEPLHVHLVLAH